MNVQVVARLRPPVSSDRTLDAGGLASNAGYGNLSIEGNQRLVNKLAGNSFTYAFSISIVYDRDSHKLLEFKT